MPHIQYNMIAINLLTIYRDEAPSAITILALFLENKNSSLNKIGIFSKIAKKNPPGYKRNGSVGLQETNNFFSSA